MKRQKKNSFLNAATADSGKKETIFVFKGAQMNVENSVLRFEISPPPPPYPLLSPC